MRKSTLLWLALAAVTGATLFHTSQIVQAGRAELAALQAKTQGEEESIRVLQAEWSYLNQPQRLEKLSREYLDLKPMQGRQFAKLEDIPKKPVSEETAVSPDETASAQIEEKVAEKEGAEKEQAEKKQIVQKPPVEKVVAKPPVVKTAPVAKASTPAKTLPKTLKPVMPVQQVQKETVQKQTDTASGRQFGDLMKSLGVE